MHLTQTLSVLWLITYGNTKYDTSNFVVHVGYNPSELYKQSIITNLEPE